MAFQTLPAKGKSALERIIEFMQLAPDANCTLYVDLFTPSSLIRVCPVYGLKDGKRLKFSVGGK